MCGQGAGPGRQWERRAGRAGVRGKVSVVLSAVFTATAQPAVVGGQRGRQTFEETKIQENNKKSFLFFKSWYIILQFQQNSKSSNTKTLKL